MTEQPVILSDDTRTLLHQLADKLVADRPAAAMHESIRRAQALVLAEQMHGPTEKAVDAEQQLLAAAPPVRDHQTRRQYAALLRLIMQEAGSR
ncbi:hypothetical protein GCM10010387_22540 [Streptomyces inusitatus]|uniref:Uncharacterized protein n=1 Tax=Streptomyces inusitatus TaxID=68221 RepID=A0A918PZN8_9ACTN|nr:hypothetical protein [Streptomyces inusitatus]GGZ28569.1 hypothetical protein GCM10010387_22540 [Streptomyces inusitatus]